MADVSPDDILSWVAATGTAIPGQFCVNAAKRESSLRNLAPAQDNTQVSVGLFQMNAEEAQNAGLSYDDLRDPQQNTIAYVKNQEIRADKIAAAAGVDDWRTSAPDDFWYYLAAAHNAGTGKILEWINRDGGLHWDITAPKEATFNGDGAIVGYSKFIGDGAIQSRAQSAVQNTLGSDDGTTDPNGTDLGGGGIAVLIVGALMLLGGRV